MYVPTLEVEHCINVSCISGIVESIAGEEWRGEGGWVKADRSHDQLMLHANLSLCICDC